MKRLPVRIGETAAGEMPAGTAAGEIPAGETPAGETPAGETPAGETPAGETGGDDYMLCGEVTERAIEATLLSTAGYRLSPSG